VCSADREVEQLDPQRRASKLRAESRSGERIDGSRRNFEAKLHCLISETSARSAAARFERNCFPVFPRRVAA
jgi:hypothetical protein